MRRRQAFLHKDTTQRRLRIYAPVVVRLEGSSSLRILYRDVVGARIRPFDNGERSYYPSSSVRDLEFTSGFLPSLYTSYLNTTPGRKEALILLEACMEVAVL